MYIFAVAPFAGAWIEIDEFIEMAIELGVAPFAGAWIEIYNSYFQILRLSVAPFAGAWIEIGRKRDAGKAAWSHPSRVRGLKLQECILPYPRGGRTLRGCVD